MSDGDACPITGEANCRRCSGEYCEQHFSRPCNCDVISRHTAECLIPATGDHPDMVGYMVGPDDGKALLKRTPQEAVDYFKQHGFNEPPWPAVEIAKMG